MAPGVAGVASAAGFEMHRIHTATAKGSIPREEMLCQNRLAFTRKPAADIHNKPDETNPCTAQTLPSKRLPTSPSTSFP
jgi:hypothetical protein